MADDFCSNDDDVPPTPGRGIDFPTEDYSASPSGYRSATPDQESFHHLLRDENCADTAVRYTLKDTNSTDEWSEQYIQNEQQTSLSPGDDNYASPKRNHTSKNTDPIEESNEKHLQREQSLFHHGVDSNFSGTKHVVGWNRCTPDGGVQTHFRAKHDKNLSGTREGKRFDGRMAARGGRSHPYRDSVRTSGSGPRAARDMLPRRATGLGREVPPGFEKPLRPNAWYTVYVDGLPLDITEREVAHIFRPFDGYRRSRLFTKDYDRPEGAWSVTLCFVDFTDEACARKAMDLLRGYKVDLKDPDAPGLRLKFARDTRWKVGTRPGPYNGPWSRGRERERSW